MDAVLKTAVGAILPWVRIPPLPPFPKNRCFRDNEAQGQRLIGYSGRMIDWVSCEAIAWLRREVL